MPPELPYDIIFQIVQNLQKSHPYSVISLCLVSQAFVVPCQQHIFQKIEFIAAAPYIRQYEPGSIPRAYHVPANDREIPPKFIILRETLEKSPHLVEYVKTLGLVNLGTVDPDSDDDDDDDPFAPGQTGSTTPLLVSGWVLNDPNFLARMLELLDEAPITKIVLEGDHNNGGIRFDWDWFPYQIKAGFQAIFAKGKVETLVLQNMILPSTFFGGFGRGVGVNRGEGSLKEIRLLRTAVKIPVPKGDGNRLVSYRTQKPARFQLAPCYARPGFLDSDLWRMGPSIGLDLSNICVLKLMLLSRDVKANDLFAVMGKSLRELYIWANRVGLTDTPLNLSPLKGLEKLALIDTPCLTYMTLPQLRIQWFIDTLSSLSKPLPSIQTISVEFSTAWSEGLTSPSTLQAFSNVFSGIYDGSPSLKRVEIGIVVFIKYLAETLEKEEEAKGMRDLMVENIQWVDSTKILKVEVHSDSSFPSIVPWTWLA